MTITGKLQNIRLVPVVSLPSVDAGLKLSELLLRCRMPVIEITYRTACAADAMTQISKQYPELLAIAGTVLSTEQVDQAIEAGAKGIVSPGFTTKLAAHCRQRNIGFFPGVCTPSEVQMAREEGLYNLKFFPASLSGGIHMISLFKALYQDVKFMPTGGINQDNLLDYLKNDNILCCGGTWLCPEKLMADDRWDEIENRVKAAVELLGN